jgi:hypothetical protein
VLEDQQQDFVALGFPVDEDFGNPLDRWMHRDLFGLMHWFYGDVGNIQNEHLCLLTPTKLVDQVGKAGFFIEKMAKPEAVNLVLIARKV